MSYLVLARKWRPQTFRDLIGQDHVTQTLKNAILSGRVAHAFLFTGARGVGKTSSARIMAKALNCEQGLTTEPCNVCPACLEITAGNSVDVFEIDGASNTSVDDIRELRENIKYLPSRCRYKIFIIDEVHMLSTSAFNALLKTLEEPPAHVKFIFATTEPHKVPITILSRCQRFDFKRIPLQMIVGQLRHIVGQEGVNISEAALGAIARKGDGSMRDSLSVLDQVLAFCGESVDDKEVASILGVVDRRLIMELSRALFVKDCAAVLDVVSRVDGFGYSMRQFCQELIDHFRNLTIISVVREPSSLLELSDAELDELGEIAAAASVDDLQRHIAILLKADIEMAHTSFPRLVMEMALLKMARLAPVVPVNEILGRLRAIENGGGGKVAAPGPVWTKPPENKGVREERSAGKPASPAGNSANVPPAPPLPASEREEVEPPGVASPPAAGLVHAPEDWSGFVSFVRGKRLGLASLLEHGAPVNLSGRRMEIGFPAGSFYLSSIQDADNISAIREFAAAYFQVEREVKVITLSQASETAQTTIFEKKKLEEDARIETLERESRENPMVAAAIEIFGGEIGEIKKLD